jgi:hypothetical protein
MANPEYMFDWRAEAERDGWLLGSDGNWRHRVTDEVKSDANYVYTGDGVWAETWPHPPNRTAAGRARDAAFVIS